MKYVLTTVLALLLTNGATAMAQQPDHQDRGGQGDNQGDQKGRDQKGKDKDKGQPQGPAQGRDQVRPPEQPQAPAQGRDQVRPPEQQQAPAQGRDQFRPQEQQQAPEQRRDQYQGQYRRDEHQGADQRRDQYRPDERRDQYRRDEQGQGPEQRRDQHRFDEQRQGRDQYRWDEHHDHDRPDMRDHREEYGDRSGHAHWARGDRLPDQYRQRQYYVNDWRQYGLRQPPRGYRWIRNDDNDFFLASIDGWMIGDVVYREDRDLRWRQRYARTYTYDDDIYYRECRSEPDPAGVMVGALIGGILGHEAGGRHNRGGSTIAGVIIGGAVGAAMTSNLDCQDRSYAYRSYSDAFNAGRPDTVYRWRNPRNDHRGEFRVNNYYYDPSGFRCANYSQRVYIDGRRQEARGAACLQPDGAWAIVND